MFEFKATAYAPSTAQECPGSVTRRETPVEELSRLRVEVAQLRHALMVKDALIHDIDHRTKNTLQMAVGMLELQARRSGSPQVRQALERAVRRLVALAAAHADLNRGDQDNLVQVDRYLRSLCAALTSDEPEAPEVDVRCDALACPPEVAIPVGLITSELVFNSLKYAFPEGRSGSICVILRGLEDGLAELEVRDDGVGRPPGKPDGLGTRIVQAFAAQLHGHVETWSAPDAGVSTRIRFHLDGHRD
jgi:two-component sensor histidine kinase